MEEILLDYMGVFGNDAEFTVDYGGGLSKNKIRLTVPGKPVDPFSLADTHRMKNCIWERPCQNGAASQMEVCTGR